MNRKNAFKICQLPSVLRAIVAHTLGIMAQLCNSTSDMKQESLGSDPNKILQVRFWLKHCLSWQVNHSPTKSHYELFKLRKLYQGIDPEQARQMPH